MKTQLDPQRSWYMDNKVPHPCVLVTKWTAFRNLEGWPFPSRCDALALADLTEMVSRVLLESFDDCEEKIDWLGSTPLAQSLADERLLTPGHGTRYPQAISWFWNKERFGLHWGGADHLRLDYLRPGGEVAESFRELQGWEGRFAKSLGFAYRSGWGWVTTDPAFAGAGLIPSVLLHLPASAASGLWEAMMKTVERRGFSLSPVWVSERGESDFFWLRGSFSFGRSADELAQTLGDLAEKITLGEMEARRREQETRFVDVEDRVSRAWGLLTNARKLTWEETLPALSALRRAPEMVIMNKEVARNLDRLFLRLQGAQLRVSFSEREGEEDRNRALVVRKMLLEGEDACLKD